MKLSVKNAAPETIVKMKARLEDIEKNDPRRDDVNWEQLHLYMLLRYGETKEAIGKDFVFTKHNRAFYELADEFPDLIVIWE